MLFYIAETVVPEEYASQKHYAVPIWIKYYPCSDRDADAGIANELTQPEKGLEHEQYKPGPSRLSKPIHSLQVAKATQNELK